MNKRRDYIISGFLLLISIVTSLQSFGQQQSLIGHHDFLGYYNPSLNAAGKFADVSFIHRTQWEGFGPVSNTLYFKYPFRYRARILSPKAIGAFLQYEDRTFLTSTSFQVFTSNVLAEFYDYKVGIGLSAGVTFTGLKVGEFDLEELIDPELSNLDKDVTTINRLGLSFGNESFEFGVSSSVEDFKNFSDINSSLRMDLPLQNPKYVVIPVLIFRTSETFDTQLEAQARVTYNRKLSLTVGYRQHFGTLFQLGIVLNKKVRGSYGSELPSGGNSVLELTHEIFASLKFETPTNKRHVTDSIFKAQRDSINRAKIDSIRTARVNVLEAEEDEEDQLDLGVEEEKPVIEEIDPEEPKAQDETPEGVISFDEISNQLGKNTHVILDHIGFEQGLYLLKPYAFDELDRLVSYIKHHKHLHIEIQGHTDDLGSSEHNHLLSKRRALTVYNYLVSRGIDAARLNVVGYGEDLPLFPNDSEKHRSLNRRIEMVFIELEGQGKK